jgi:hypothetical protein
MFKLICENCGSEVKLTKPASTCRYGEEIYQSTGEMIIGEFHFSGIFDNEFKVKCMKCGEEI